MSGANVSVEVTGALLTEAVRASLHRGCPSAVLARIAAGVDQFCVEMHAAGKCDSETATFVEPLAGHLRRVAAEWRKHEERTYQSASVRVRICKRIGGIAYTRTACGMWESGMSAGEPYTKDEADSIIASMRASDREAGIRSTYWAEEV